MPLSGPLIWDTAKLLHNHLWLPMIEENTQKGMPRSGPLLRDTAKLLHNHLSGVGGASMSAVGISGTSSPFTASRGWFQCFKARYNLRNVKLIGGCTSEDHDMAEAFLAELASLIEEKGYLPEQVFNADETSSFWKKMPTRTFISA